MEKSRKDILKELREISPDFPDIKGKEKFGVPEGYFDQLQKEVLSKVTEEDTPVQREAKVRTLFNTRTLLAIASVALIVVVAAIAILRPADNNEILADISNDEAMEYVLANIDDFEGLIDDEVVGADVDLNFIGSFEEDELDDVLDNLIDDLDEETLQSIL